jgi:hypothetical protein
LALAALAVVIALLLAMVVLRILYLIEVWFDERQRRRSRRYWR